MLWLIVKSFLIGCGVALVVAVIMLIVYRLMASRQRAAFVVNMLIFIALFIANAALVRMGILDGMQGAEVLLGIVFGPLALLSYLALRNNAEKATIEMRYDDDFYWQEASKHIDIDD
ncbi:hypothetical protein IKX12_01850 [Candidatus Saccharibacteria bacterium]|nr:hypothetical protein [Candidatus Saccharibacteria bacterium]